MKALHFAKPLEYRLDIPQDDARQGDLLRGTVTVVNRGTQPRTDLRLELGLAYGNFKKVKDKGVEAMEFLERHLLTPEFALAPGEQRSAGWELPLRMDGPITTKDGGPFLIYGGNLDDPGARGVIDLRVDVAPAVAAFIATLETRFAFEERTRGYGDGFTTVKLKPPSTYPTLAEFYVSLRIGEEGLQLRFRCKLKRFGRGAKAGLGSRQEVIERTFHSREYQLGNGQPNRELYRKAIQEALSEVLPSGLLPT
jgi:sporulation-control protein spo0M